MFFEKIGWPAALELLAEECTELAHAALKMSRLDRGENPTPMTYSEINDQLEEEAVDVYLCLFDLGLVPNPNTMYDKCKRFRERVEEMESQEDSDEENPYVRPVYCERVGLKGDPGPIGPMGPKGDSGRTPVKGEDYWTKEDREEINNYIIDQIAKMLTAQTWVND